MCAARKVLLAVVCVVVMANLVWQGLKYRGHLHYVPAAMNVWWVRHAAEESWGIGLPGDTEVGMIVYDMPTEVQRELQTRGLGWLQSLSAVKRSGWEEWYETWQVTPIPTDLRWTDPSQCPPKDSDRYRFGFPNGCPSIIGYMGGYGRPASLDPETEKMVNEALASPGSYYAFGAMGILILIPAQERIVYVYSS